MRVREAHGNSAAPELEARALQLGEESALLLSREAAERRPRLAAVRRRDPRGLLPGGKPAVGSKDGGDRPRGAGLDLAGLLEAAGLEGTPESDEPRREEVVRGPDRAPRAGRERLEELLVASGED